MTSDPTSGGILAVTGSWERFTSHLGDLTPAQWALGTALSLAAILGAGLLRRAIRMALELLFARARATTHDTPTHEAVDRFEGLLRKLLTIGLALALLLVLSEVWGFDGPAQFSWGRRAGSALGGIGLVLLLAALAWRGVKVAVDSLLAPASAPGRAATASQVITGLARLIIALLATLVILSELGINIVPLVAGAGIAGLALSFGAQTLVRDLLTGLMIVFEDSVAIGDEVKIGDHRGRVERLGVRSIRLRSSDGALHVIPYGEIKTLTNLTRTP